MLSSDEILNFIDTGMNLTIPKLAFIENEIKPVFLNEKF